MASNIWNEFLSKSSSRTQNEYSTVVILGDAKSGKTALIEKMCADKNLSMQVEEEDAAELEKNEEIKAAQKELLTYNYFYIDDEDDTTDDSRVNVWSADDHMFEHIYAIVGDANKEERLMIIVTLDLSKPNDQVIASLEKWLLKAASYINDYYKAMGDNDSSKKIRSNTVNYLKQARISRGMGENLTDPVDEYSAEVAAPEDAEGAEESKESILFEEVPDPEQYPFIGKFFGLPLLVVGCKADLLPKDDPAAFAEAVQLQGQIRAMCLDVGASVIYCSTLPEGEGYLKRLKKYIEHRLYPENLLIQQQQKELEMEDELEKTFIPGGLDSLSMIRMSMDLDLIPNTFRSNFNPNILDSFKIYPDIDSTVGEDTPVPAEIESEQEWLTSLYGFITQVSGGSLVADVPMPAESNQRRDGALGSSGASSALAGGSVSGRRSSSAAGGKAVGFDISSPNAKSSALSLLGNEGQESRESESARRRRSVTTTSAGEKQDVGDFFKNLLQAGNGKK